MKQQEPFKTKDIKNQKTKIIKLKKHFDKRMKSGTANHVQSQSNDLEVKEIMIGRLEKLENLLIHIVTFKKQQIRLVIFNQ